MMYRLAPFVEFFATLWCTPLQILEALLCIGNCARVVELVSVLLRIEWLQSSEASVEHDALGSLARSPLIQGHPQQNIL